MRFIILKGDLDAANVLMGTHPASVKTQYIGYVFELNYNQLVGVMSSPRGGAFRKALNNPNLPNDSSATVSVNNTNTDNNIPATPTISNIIVQGSASNAPAPTAKQ